MQNLHWMNETMLTISLGMLGFVLVIGIILLVISIIGCWRIFTKSGEQGWKALIPFLSEYTMFKVTWKPMWYWILLASIIVDLALWYSGISVLVGLSWVFTVFTNVIGIIAYYKMAKAFGYGMGFTFGLIFLWPIFILILAFGKAEYIGNYRKEGDEQK